jgi:type I restriction enzyme S subunit
MAPKWIETTVGDQVTLQRGIDITRAQQKPGTVPVVSSGGIASYHDTVAINGPGVVLGRKGVVGSVWYLDQDYWPHDTTLYVKDFKGNDPSFVYYFFKWKTASLAALDVGSANPTLNRNHVHPMKVRWPELTLQIVISEILKTLDDKIELNRKMNETLEQMARAMFKSWFIDFDPVKAKRDGKKPFGMDDATAALFPDSFEPSELGEIPRGWKVRHLGEYIDTISETFKFAPCQQVVFLNTSDILDGEILVSTYSESRTLPGQAKKRIRYGDILFSEIRPANKRYALIDFDGDDFVVSTKLMVLRSKNIDPVFPYFYLTTPDVTGLLQHLAESRSGTFPQITFDQVKPLKVCLPENAILDRFIEILKGNYGMRSHNTKESKTLAQTRDLLLPRLLSGELQVKGLP